MKPCPAAMSCQWHNRALAWVRAGNRERIRQERDILLVLLTRAWRGCTCGLAARVRALL
jgi:hypothetical protein